MLWLDRTGIFFGSPRAPLIGAQSVSQPPAQADRSAITAPSWRTTAAMRRVLQTQAESALQVPALLHSCKASKQPAWLHACRASRSSRWAPLPGSSSSSTLRAAKFACYMWEGFTTAHMTRVRHTESTRQRPGAKQVRMLYVGRLHNGTQDQS